MNDRFRKHFLFLQKRIYILNHDLIRLKRLRNSDSFVPDLSLVCEMNEMIVGYILLTKIKIKHSDFSYDSLALAPVAVLSTPLIIVLIQHY